MGTDLQSPAVFTALIPHSVLRLLFHLLLQDDLSGPPLLSTPSLYIPEEMATDATKHSAFIVRSTSKKPAYHALQITFTCHWRLDTARTEKWRRRILLLKRTRTKASCVLHVLWSGTLAWIRRGQAKALMVISPCNLSLAGRQSLHHSVLQCPAQAALRRAQVLQRWQPTQPRRRPTGTTRNCYDHGGTLWDGSGLISTG